jgi:hypothetical protein
MSALLRDFLQGGPAAIAKVRKYQPAAYMKICALLVPREHKVEHSNAIEALTDEELEAMIEHLKASLAAQAQGAAVILQSLPRSRLPRRSPRRLRQSPSKNTSRLSGA